MLKTGFRGERKRILTPSLSQGEGVYSDGKVGIAVVVRRCESYGQVMNERRRNEEKVKV